MPFRSLIAAYIAVALTSPAFGQQDAAPLTLASQGSFFVGGRDVRSETLTSGTNRVPTGTVTVDQVYVRYQVPAGATRPPIVLIHGCCLTGKTWETTPDGRMGWDEYFLRNGHAVYVVDQAARGRSAVDPSGINSVKLARTKPEQLPTVSFVSHEEAWTVFRFGPEYPKVFPGLQFPLDAQDEFWKQMVPDWNQALPTPNPTIAGLSELSQRLNGTVLVSHSQSGIFPFQVAALNTKGIAGIVSIEPGACPSASADVTPYTKLPVLILWADYVSLSSRWTPRLTACKAFAEVVNKAGGHVENILLPEVGMLGNSHMLMQDRNSLQVADWLLAWIARNVENTRN